MVQSEPGSTSARAGAQEWWHDPNRYVAQARPVSATLIMVGLVLLGLLGLAFVGLVWELEVVDPLDHGEDVPALIYILCVLQALTSLAMIGAGMLVRRGREWGRVLGMAACGFSVVGGMVSLLVSRTPTIVIGVVLYLGLIGALSRSDVKRWCE
jgi:multisubunit Na+/H+ antiporter MnhF subunit